MGGEFRALTVWRRAMELMVESYRVAARLPQVERFALGSQIRRSAVSVPANIAEGHARDHLGDYLHHLAIASGSLAELQTLLIAAKVLDYVPAEQVSRPLSLSLETERMLYALRRAIRTRRHQSPSTAPRARRSTSISPVAP